MKKEKMKDAIKWFEIPVKDLTQAKEFYEGIFNIDMQEFQPNDSLKMAIFPITENSVGGAICESPDFYKPSNEGTLIFLNADPDLQMVLDRVGGKGGKVVIEKRQISEVMGYMAVFEDIDGNRIGLMSST